MPEYSTPWGDLDAKVGRSVEDGMKRPRGCAASCERGAVPTKDQEKPSKRIKVTMGSSVKPRPIACRLSLRDRKRLRESRPVTPQNRIARA